jgi:hypothetical protein
MKSISKIFLIIILSTVFLGCEEEYECVIGSIGMQYHIEIGRDYAILGVHIHDNIHGSYYKLLDYYGVCYSDSLETSSPTINNNDVKDIRSGYDYDDYYGCYKVRLNNLKAGTTYYWRAFIQKNDIIVYGDVQSFTTLSVSPPLILPIVSTLEPVNITSTTSTLRGNITNVGNPAYHSKGFCCATWENPSLGSGIQISVGSSGTGYFEWNYTGFKPNTTYYVRAYATNSSGTAYGEQVSFKTEK